MMKLQPLFKHTSYGFQFFLFLGLLLFGLLFGMLLALLILHFAYGMELGASANFLSDSENLTPARIMQMASQVGLFLFPPLMLAWVVSEKPMRFLGITPIRNPKILLPAVLLMFASLPLVHGLSELNHAIQLPAALSGLEEWMKLKETQAEEMTKFFLSVDSLAGLGINLVMIALLPAIGEELVFRSVLQPYMMVFVRNKHIALVLTALIFSFIHFQFYGLIPRFALGLFLGYFYYWSGSIFVSMLMHFVNNGAAVLGFYLYHNGYTNTSMEDMGSTTSLGYVALSIIIVIGLMWIGYKLRSTK
ncbi:MAG: CPBP family intramembrane metalloprotease [Bacteroidales bacterium]|jgi:membrane protease YdiL (CAAX protease family)|nr:CPBP family intramembrane metalloprotease [Bacteroidales bacterium]